MTDINYPWFAYPNAPHGGYLDAMFKPELIRLFTTIIDLRTITNPTLLHLTIGSPMEEIDIKTIYDKDIIFQMHQLIPDHLITTAELGIGVICIIVCPNKIITPLFMVFTEEYDKIDDYEYKHKTLPITTKIFNTMMPTKDKKRNDILITRIANNTIYDIDYNNIYKQTDNDITFISTFYNELSKTLKHITNCKGFNSCFSFAVFNNSPYKETYNKYCMFKELYTCYKNHNSDTIICEWVFSYKHYVVYNLSHNENIAISFIPLDQLVIVDPHAICYFACPVFNENILSYSYKHTNELIDNIHKYLQITQHHINANEHMYGYLLNI
jgi:hypothetical protein